MKYIWKLTWPCVSKSCKQAAFAADLTAYAQWTPDAGHYLLFGVAACEVRPFRNVLTMWWILSRFSMSNFNRLLQGASCTVGSWLVWQTKIKAHMHFCWNGRWKSMCSQVKEASWQQISYMIVARVWTQQLILARCVLPSFYTICLLWSTLPILDHSITKLCQGSC